MRVKFLVSHTWLIKLILMLMSTRRVEVTLAHHHHSGVSQPTVPYWEIHDSWDKNTTMVLRGNRVLSLSRKCSFSWCSLYNTSWSSLDATQTSRPNSFVSRYNSFVVFSSSYSTKQSVEHNSCMDVHCTPTPSPKPASNELILDVQQKREDRQCIAGGKRTKLKPPCKSAAGR